jgi:Domain of unknown function (DUF4105)
MIKILFIAILSLSLFGTVSGQEQPNDTTVYLLTCASGNETYSLWGHSALRVVIQATQTDKVYNWGVFDFDTPNFAWKFAKGHLDYMLGVYNYNVFIRDYFLERRSVISQKVNLNQVEKLRLMLLLRENMKPENRNYRYDFLYDNCSTRIRDIIEKLIGPKLIYPPDDPEHTPTFRDKIHEYTSIAPWTKTGIDLLLGTPTDKKASFRDRMFLPDYLQKNLTQAIINRDRKMLPLLYPEETILDMPAVEAKPLFFTSPVFVFSLLFVIIVFLSAGFRKSAVITFIDIALFLIFSLIAVLLVFFSFFTDHIETRLNLNILWFNPFLLPCLWSVIRGTYNHLWFRIVFFTSLIFVPLIFIMPDAINVSFVPVMFILLLRSSSRAGFSWNPLSVENPTNG